MKKLLSAALAVLLAVASGYPQGAPSQGFVTVTGTNTVEGGIYNQPTLVVPQQTTANRLWLEIVNCIGTNKIMVCENVPVLTTTTIGSSTYTNWKGTVLGPGGSFVLRPYGEFRYVAGHPYYVIVIGTGNVGVGFREYLAP